MYNAPIFIMHLYLDKMPFYPSHKIYSSNLIAQTITTPHTLTVWPNQIRPKIFNVVKNFPTKYLLNTIRAMFWKVFITSLASTTNRNTGQSRVSYRVILTGLCLSLKCLETAVCMGLDPIVAYFWRLGVHTVGVTVIGLILLNLMVISFHLPEEAWSSG